MHLRCLFLTLELLDKVSRSIHCLDDNVRYNYYFLNVVRKLASKGILWKISYRSMHL